MTAPSKPEDMRDPRISSEQERQLERVNDPTALNGGSASHWYVPDRAEQTPSTRQQSKFVIAIILWGTLACGVLLLAASL